MLYTYDYPRPAVTVDVVLFAMRAGGLSVLLIRRAHAPFKGAWALPGGFVDTNETLHAAAVRELAEETGVRGVSLEQLGAFGDPGRDPRGHTVSVAYFTFVVAESRPILAGDDAAEAAWHRVQDLALDPSRSARPPSKRPAKSRPRARVELAFDHALFIVEARRRLRERVEDPARASSSFELVPSRFTLTELQRVHEAILGRRLDGRTFRARVLAGGLVESVAVRRARRRHAEPLYRWRGANDTR